MKSRLFYVGAVAVPCVAFKLAQSKKLNPGKPKFDPAFLESLAKQSQAEQVETVKKMVQQELSREHFEMPNLLASNSYFQASRQDRLNDLSRLLDDVQKKQQPSTSAPSKKA